MTEPQRLPRTAYRSAPRWRLIYVIAYGALVPMALLTLAMWVPGLGSQAWLGWAVCSAAALFGSFIGGIHWGIGLRYMATHSDVPTFHFVWGPVPPYLAWGTLLLPVDIAANAESWGIKVIRVKTIDEFEAAYAEAVASDVAVMIHIETNLYGPNPPGSSWWDVPISEVSRIESTQQAREWYVGMKQPQRQYLN